MILKIGMEPNVLIVVPTKKEMPRMEQNAFVTQTNSLHPHQPVTTVKPATTLKILVI